MQQCNCGSKRMFSILAHAKDLHSYSFESPDEGVSVEGNGYAPHVDYVCAGDDTDIIVCVDCGKLQGFKPISTEKMVALIKDDE